MKNESIFEQRQSIEYNAQKSKPADCGHHVQSFAINEHNSSFDYKSKPIVKCVYTFTKTSKPSAVPCVPTISICR